MKKLAILLLFPSLAFAQVQVQGKPGGAIQIGGNQPGVSSIQGATGDFTFDGTGFSGCSTSGGTTTCTFNGGSGLPTLTTDGRSGNSGLSGSTLNIPSNLGGNVYALPNFSSLVGAFTDSTGNVIQPVALGIGPTTFSVPYGATQLQLGINDANYSDVSGSWVVSVNGTNYTVPGTSAPWLHTGGINATYPTDLISGTAPVVASVGVAGTPVTVQYVSGTISNGAICGGGSTGPWTASGQPNCTVTINEGLVHPGFWTQTALGSNAAFSLTTTGTSGPATYTGGILNIPQYSGGGGTPGGSTGQLQYNNAGAFGGDTGSTTDGAGNVTTKTLSTTGTAGAGGLLKAVEGTAPSAAAGYDILYADSASHCFKQSLNGGSFACLGTGSGSVNVNGTPVSSPNLQDSATVTFGVSGSNIQATATGGGGSSAAQTNYGFSSAGLAQEVHITDSTGPGGVLVLSGAPVNGTGTNQCPGPGSPPANQGLTYYRYDTTPAQIFYCDLTEQVWKSGPAYSSTSVQLFQNYNQQSPYSVINGVFPYAGTLYSNDATAGINTGNATTPDIANIETYPNENPPDVASPDYYVQSGTADVFNCTGGLSWPTTYSNCDLSVRGAETALLMWLGSPQHGKYLARNQTKTGTWTDTDPTSQTTTGTWSSGSTTITVASATGIAKGQRVTDTTNPNNLPSPAIVTDVTGTTVTLSIAAPAAGSSDSLKFWNTVNSPYRWGVATCGTTGATLTFNLMPATGTFYLAWLVNSGGTATADLVIDGGVATALSDNVLGSWSTPHTTTMWYGERFSLNSTLSHTVVLTVTAGSFCPLFAVTPNPQGWQGMTLPNVYAQIAPPPAGGYTSQGAVVQAAQSAVFAQMRADGFHVTPVDSFNLTWPEAKGSSLYCEYNYTCTYPSGLASNQAAGPHFNWLGDRFNADAFLQQAGRTQKLVGTDLDGNKNVTGIAGTPFCNGFTPTAGQNLQYTTSSVPVPCWGATNAAGGMTYAGTWSSANSYALGSVVSYNGNSYVSILAVPSPGSPTLIQAQSGYSSVVSPRPSILLNSNVTAGDVLYVGYSCQCSPGVTTLPTDSRGDNTWTLINNTVGTTNGDAAYLYATTIQSSGPMTVNAPAFGTPNMNMAVMEMSNVLTTYQASYHDDRQFFPNPVTWSPTFTPANPAVLVAYMMTTNNSNPVTIGAGMNMATKMQNGFSSGLGYAIVNAGTYNYGLTTSPTVSDNGFYVENSFNQANANPAPDTDTAHWVPFVSNGGTVTYTSSHTAGTADNGKLMIFNCSSACALTLPNPQPSTTWSSRMISVGSTTATVTLGSSMTFNNGSSAPAPNKYRIMSVYADSNISTDYKGEAPLSQGTNVTFSPSANSFAINSTASGGGGISTCADSSGSGTAQSCTASPTLSSVAVNTCIAYTTTTANTGTLTLNVSSLTSGAHVKKWGGGTDLAAGDMPANKSEVLCYDGTSWDAMDIGNAPSGGSSPSPTTVSVSAGATLDLSACISGSFDTYHIFSDGMMTLNSGSSVKWYVRFKVGSSFDTSTNYNYGRDGSGGAITTGQTFIEMTGNSSDSHSTGDLSALDMTLSGVNSTSANKSGGWKWQGVIGGTRFAASNGFQYVNTGAITGLKVETTGTFTGTITCQPLSQ